MDRGDGVLQTGRPVSSGRHALPIEARRAPWEETVTAFCEVEATTAELPQDTGMDWSTREPCLACRRDLSEQR